MISKTGIRFQLSSFSQALLTVCEYVWAVLVVLNGNSVYHASAEKEYWLLELCAIMTWVLLMVEMMVRKHRIKQHWAIGAVVMAVYFVIYLSVRQSDMAVLDFTFLFIVGLPGLVLLFGLLHEEDALTALLRKLFDVVVALAVVSLYYWIFGVMLEIIRPNSYILISWGSTHYAMGYDGLHFVTQLDTTFFPDEYIYRNSGIFAEAPMFNLWLDMALAGELFLTTRTSKLRVTVLTVTILTTMSTTGILFLGLCLVIHILRNFRSMDRTGRLLVLLGGSILLPALGVVSIYTMTLKSDTQSYMMRLSDYVAGVKLWWDYPVLGAGFANLQTLMKYVYSPEGIMGFSNSLTAVLGTGGLWMTLPYYVTMFGMLSARVTGDRGKRAFGWCYLFLFCTTAFFARYIAVVMIAFEATIMFGNHKTDPDL